MKRAIILAGGKGIRLYPYTRVLPKALIPLNDMPILQIIIQQLRDAGFTACTLAVSHKAHQIENYLGDGHWLGINIDYSYSPDPLGTAGPLVLVQHFEDPCLVMNCDLLTSLNFAEVYKAHLMNNSVATIVLRPHVVNISFGLVEIDSKQHVTSYVEKPTFSHLISTGIYVFNPSVLDFIEYGKYMEIPELIRKLLASNQTVNSYLFEQEWFDIGTNKQYINAEKAFTQNPELFLGSSKCTPTSALIDYSGCLPREEENYSLAYKSNPFE